MPKSRHNFTDAIRQPGAGRAVWRNATPRRHGRYARGDEHADARASHVNAEPNTYGERDAESYAHPLTLTYSHGHRDADTSPDP